jgi:SMI1/KNR4 family protein SUKH-1
MSKAKKNPWDPVFRRIRAIYHSERCYPPKTTVADLDAAERELRFNFSASYRDFAEQFGLGGELHTLPKLLPLTQPSWAKRGEWFHSVVEATRFFRSNDWRQHNWPTAPAALLKRVVVFAMDGGYHSFVFDPLEITDSHLRECRIYDINRQEEAVALAMSFGGWLEWIDAHYRIQDANEDAVKPQFPVVYKPDSSEPNPMPYYPQSLPRQKKLPSKRSLKLWLKWNNGTVGVLAKSIRDEGQANVFPVLADALEEAGCRHADLLAACRGGDPDIDGAWALQVLLGAG